MSSSWGDRLRLTIFGQSHSPAIGMTLEGIPAGRSLDPEALQAFLDRRAPGRSDLSTPRREADRPEFLSGLVENVTCGVPLTAILRNTDTRPRDYGNLRDCPRPGHGDYTAQVRYGGYQDPTGGGHGSGRLTAPLCVAGGICLQLLGQMGITIAAHIQSIGDVSDDPFDPVNLSREDLEDLLAADFPVLNPQAGVQMQEAIRAIRQEQDSLGGVIACAAVGVPAGWGDPMFGGLENRIAQLIFAIPGVRGLEFGTGFAAAAMRGSTHNDPFCLSGGVVQTTTNHHGGILGGISSGMPLVFRLAVKPTPSIGLAQQSVNLRTEAPETLVIQGRHDPCIVPRAVPVAEACLALALYDSYLCSL